MSIHKLTAGSGYDYLTRQVAALDATDKGHVGLASYYTEKGETPGVWVGSGMAGIGGLAAGDVVTADQMQALFGSGHHPLANQRAAELDQRVGRPGVASPTAADYREATRLGTPYKVYENDVSAFRVEVAKGIEALNQAAGLPSDWPVPAAERANVRTQVAREFFAAEHGREPADARELAAVIAKHSRPKTNAVAGFDLTFSPVKSVSTLWAVADPRTAAVIEQAHQLAIKDALDFIEQRALFTRMGTNGVRQVNVRGLVATAFTHRDSRAGDPDLHTHVAVANKVQTLDGKWRAIDGRVLFKATVAASETYNTALERHLVDTLGVRFAERPNPDARKRPVREIVGVEADLNHRFSKRRTSVEDRRKLLAAQFQASHGRPPTPVETLHLAQQATLQTREAKHEPRSLAEQRQAWHTEAVEVLGGGMKGAQRLKQMAHGALNPAAAARSLADSAWFTGAADRVVTAMEGGRASWQYWHVYAEAQRQVRGAHVPTNQVSTVVDLLVSEVLDARSVSLARPSDPISEPAELRRVDGASVYTVAGADLFTSAKVMAAEQRLVAAAGRRDGYTVAPSGVDLALLQSAANGVTLNAGQVTLVREMATSGARLQLAIAPAGSGKTTAMRALAGAWAEGGGTVIGLAPSAAAADALSQAMGAPTRAQRTTQRGNQGGTRTDTLAKLTHSLITGDTPDWVANIGPSTLVIIDEAGMADTLSLDAAVRYILDQGGSVRLVGDDQQLAAIGAGGVLRDIRTEHGALQLTELVRFTDPAEGAASLAMREGKPEALGFYLDRGRVHVGDLATMNEDVFSAWQADRAAGLDSIMLAPTRDLVSELNQQARAHRLDGADPASIGPVVRLADSNEASVGDLIITRSNDRRLRASATDWVKNGDRWHLLEVHRNGDLSVQHAQHGRTVRLPAEYVQASTELGYACTVHTAQGVTADSMHGLATGTESRQQLYTMLTRGRIANHVYLEIVGDGDPHSVIHPDMVRPLTATDILSSMLARDDAKRSATSLLRDQASPGVRLGEATQRYLDGLYVAAEHVVGADVVDAIDTAVDQLVPGLSDAAAWPTLRAHLLLLGAHGQDPVEALRDAAWDRELDSAEDRAAVLDWRLDASGLRNAGAGPLPWVPAIPDRLAQDEHWSAYLTQRTQLVTDLASEVRQGSVEAAAPGTLPVWAQNGMRPDETTVADVEVWRAAMQVAGDDRRPTGAPQLQKAAGSWQRRLNRRIAGDHTPALKEWSHLLHLVAPQVRGDEFTPMLAERLAAMSRAGIAAHQLVRTATAAGPLPDEHAAAALWWRMARHLTPAVAAQIGDQEQVTTHWTQRLAEMLGTERAERIQTSTWWPALVATVDHGLERGWRLEELLQDVASAEAGAAGELDECQALVWRTSIALDPIPDEHAGAEHDEQQPADLWDGYEPPADLVYVVDADTDPDLEDLDPARDLVDGDLPDVDRIDADLTLAALIRDADRRAGVVLEPTAADVRRMYQRAEEWDHSPVSKERIVEVNQLAQAFFESRFAGSWGQDYLTERFGMDLAGDDRFRPGHAPAGWTNLVDHLRRHGVTDREMLATGVATTARTGRLIDRFRNRVLFPVVHPERPSEVLGFVGRRHPTLTDVDQREGNAGPKYLNTADTPLFHKGAQLFGAHMFAAHSPTGDPRPPVETAVLVEGPMDALAVTLASAGRFVGLAPLGTALTDEQATQLAAISHQTGQDPVVATDADLAGQLAAERDFWMLTPHGLDPAHARFPHGHDPADLLARRGPAALAGALVGAHPLGDALLLERLQNLDPEQARQAALQVLAARPGAAWDPGLEQVAAHLEISPEQLRRELHTTIKTWDHDARASAGVQLQKSNDARPRLEAAAAAPPADRWLYLATELDPRLASQPDWAATAGILQEAHDEGHDVAAAARDLVAERPLGDPPARDLRYRLVSRLDMTVDTGEGTYGQGVPAVAPERPHRGVGRAEEHRRDPNSSPGRGRPRR